MSKEEDNKALIAVIILLLVVPIVLVGLLLFAGLVAGVAYYFLSDVPAEQEEFFDKEEETVVAEALTPLDVTSVEAIQRDGSEPTIRGGRVEIELVQFSDFQCGYCAERYLELRELAERHDWLQLQFKHYPLHNACNEHVSVAMHEDACAAAQAAECAHQQDLFWPMATAMFSGQDDLSASALDDKAASTGADMDLFQRCMQRQSSPRVFTDISAGRAVGVRGTPAMYAHVLHTGQWLKITTDLEHTLTALRSRPPQ